MVDLDTDQLELKASIQKSATIWGAVLGIIVAIIAYFVLGSMDTIVQLVGALVIGGAAGFGIYRWQFGSQSKSAQCGKCSAAFSITRTDRKETLAGTEDKVERKPQEDGSAEITRFTEESYDVVDSYTCASCNDVTTKDYKTTRRTNVQTKIDAAPVMASESGAVSSSSKGGLGSATVDRTPKAPPPSGLGRGGTGRST